MEENNKQVWFFVEKDNRIASGGKATGNYQNAEKELYVSLIGQLTLEDDKEIMKNLYSPIVGAFFTDGILDKDLRLMRFDISSMEIWKQDLSLSTRLKMLAGITLHPEEMGEHALIEEE